MDRIKDLIKLLWGAKPHLPYKSYKDKILTVLDKLHNIFKPNLQILNEIGKLTSFNKLQSKPVLRVEILNNIFNQSRNLSNTNSINNYNNYELPNNTIEYI